MKKLRATDQEKNLFIDDIIKKMFDSKTSIDDFSIEDLKKEYTKLPKEIKKPTVTITGEAYIKMLELVNQSKVECSWHGLVKRYEPDKYLIHKILVFPQINSPTSTTTDEKEFAEWQTELIMDPDFPIEELRMHGHSHVMMNVFSSGIDDQYQKDLITKVDNGDYYIFIIMNKKMEMCIFLYDFDQQVMFETKDITLEIDTGTGDIRKWAKDQLNDFAITERPALKKSYDICSSTYQEDEEEYYSYSYFNRSKPIFKGAKNGFK